MTAKDTRVNSTLPVLAAGVPPAGVAAGLLLVPWPQDATVTLKVIPTKNSDTNLFSAVNDLFVPTGGCCGQ